MGGLMHRLYGTKIRYKSIVPSANDKLKIRKFGAEEGAGINFNHLKYRQRIRKKVISFVHTYDELYYHRNPSMKAK